MPISVLVRLAPIVFVCLWATGFIGARMGMPYAEPGTFLAVRFALACLLLAALALIMRAPWPGRAVAGQQVLVGFLLHGTYLGCVFWAVDRGMPAGVSAIIVGLQPVLTAVLAGWLLGELISRRHWLAMALGVVGVALVVWPKLSFSSLGITPVTVTVCVMGMVSATLGTVVQKRFGGTVDLRTGTAFQYVGAVIPVALLSLATETRDVIWTGELIFAFVWLVLVLSIGAIFLLLWLLRQGSVAKVSSLFFLVPAVAALMANGLFGETLNGVQVFGMGVSGFAVALSSRA
ncbi:MAG: DMT family transporter [Pseudomonadota bacterium]